MKDQACSILDEKKIHSRVNDLHPGTHQGKLTYFVTHDKKGKTTLGYALVSFFHYDDEAPRIVNRRVVGNIAEAKGGKLTSLKKPISFELSHMLMARHAELRNGKVLDTTISSIVETAHQEVQGKMNMVKESFMERQKSPEM